MVSLSSRTVTIATFLTFLLMVAASKVSSTASPVKDFTLPSATDGKVLHLADFSGKVVLINFWRTSCGWSQRESPKLVELYKNYRDRGLVILGVSDDTSDSVAQIPAYLKKYGITWPVGLNDQGEFTREIVPQSKVGGRPAGETPGNYIVTRSGGMTYLGLDRSPEAWDKLVETVKQALDEKIPTAYSIMPRDAEPAPSLALPDLEGNKKITSANFSGKPLVVNFFNSQTCDWTGAVISKLHRDYAARGLQVIGIDLFDSDDAVRQCAGKYGAQYPVLRGDQATQAAWIGGTNAWATFFITADGKVLKKIVDSTDNGIEAAVFPKYAEYLLAKR